ncbi:MAG: DNA polymerase IV [Gammaproteobacteria bacterium]
MNNYKTNCPLIWPRAILLVDMNAFFASIEQLDFAYLQGQPVAVTNGEQGSCIITCSYEARRYGVKTGMRLYEARERCPTLIQRAARPKRYAQLSRLIMRALEAITPDIEVYSVDEAFLDLTHCQRLHGTPLHIARITQTLIKEVSQLPCSIGVSGNKTMAKYAAKIKKPNGITIVPPWEAKAWLEHVPVTELCGIASGVKRFLARYNVVTCGDMKRLPVSVLAQRFGHVGRRIWMMCQGEDSEPLNIAMPPPKSMGHGKVLPPNTKNREVLLTYFQHMSEKLAERLRTHEMQAQHFFIGLRCRSIGWLGGKYYLSTPSDDGKLFFELCEIVLNHCWQGEGVHQVQITALDPRHKEEQSDFFSLESNDALHHVVDSINHRYGRLTVCSARLIRRSSMPDVIPPAWKAEGVRQVIDD